jgi:hypothetical protein
MQLQEAESRCMSMGYRCEIERGDDSRARREERRGTWAGGEVCLYKRA